MEGPRLLLNVGGLYEEQSWIKPKTLWYFRNK
jgi:hypothetical protein